jgi:hypothetical protein
MSVHGITDKAKIEGQQVPQPVGRKVESTTEDFSFDSGGLHGFWRLT